MAFRQLNYAGIAGHSFTPHLITVAQGEVAILFFSLISFKHLQMTIALSRLEIAFSVRNYFLYEIRTCIIFAAVISG